MIRDDMIPRENVMRLDYRCSVFLFHFIKKTVIKLVVVSSGSAVQLF